MVALRLGERGAPVDLLVGALHADNEWSVHAAGALARAKVAAAAPQVADLLERTDPQHTKLFLSVSGALRELGGQPSASTRQRVAREAAGWVREAFESDFA